jgi:hypothetical protein
MESVHSAMSSYAQPFNAWGVAELTGPPSPKAMS